MLQAVAADQVAGELEDAAVEELQNLGKAVPGDHPAEEPAVGIVVVTKRPDDDGQSEHGVELHQRVVTQVAAAQRFGPVPVKQAREAEREQYAKQPAITGLGVYPVGYYGGTDRHERDGHGQPVPQQAGVGRCPVIVARAQADQGDASEENQVRTRVGAGREQVVTLADQDDERHHADYREPDVGGHIAEVGDAEHPACVDELMIGEVLRDRIHGEHYGKRDGEQPDKDGEA